MFFDVFSFSQRFSNFVGNNLTSYTRMYTQWQWRWKKNKARMIDVWSRSPHELSEVKIPPNSSFHFFRHTSTKRCLTEFSALSSDHLIIPTGVSFLRKFRWLFLVTLYYSTYVYRGILSFSLLMMLMSHAEPVIKKDYTQVPGTIVPSTIVFHPSYIVDTRLLMVGPTQTDWLVQNQLRDLPGGTHLPDDIKFDGPCLRLK